MALAMPDICRSLERPDISPKTTGKWYRDWVTRYIEGEYTAGRFEECKFYAQDFWLYRCSCLHAGVDPENKKRMMKFNFTPPPGSGHLVHLNHYDGKLQLQIDVFCRDMIAAVNRWYEEVKEDPVIINRMEGLISISSASYGSFIRFS